MKTLPISIALAATLLTACVGAPEPTTFVMENVGDAEIFHDEFGWLTLTADGKPASFVEPSCSAPCGSLGGQIVCALGAQLQSAHRLMPGESVSQDWDGVYYEIDEERGCYRERKRDADLRVTFCYGTNVEGEFENGEMSDPDVILGGYVVDPVCEEVAFERGGEVELLAE